MLDNMWFTLMYRIVFSTFPKWTPYIYAGIMPPPGPQWTNYLNHTVVKKDDKLYRPTHMPSCTSMDAYKAHAIERVNASLARAYAEYKDCLFKVIHE